MGFVRFHPNWGVMRILDQSVTYFYPGLRGVVAENFCQGGGVRCRFVFLVLLMQHKYQTPSVSTKCTTLLTPVSISSLGEKRHSLYQSKGTSRNKFARLHHDPLLAWTSRHQNTRRVLTRSQISDLSSRSHTRPLRQNHRHSNHALQDPSVISTMQRNRPTRCSPESINLIIRVH